MGLCLIPCAHGWDGMYGVCFGKDKSKMDVDEEWVDEVWPWDDTCTNDGLGDWDCFTGW